MQRCCKVKRYASLFFRQKNRRTKEGIENQTNIQASLMFCCSFNAAASSMLSTQLYLLKKNKSYYSITIVAMPSYLAGTRNLMFMDCRKRYFCRWHLCHHWDKIPGPSQGWRCREHYAVALWKYTFKRQKNIRTKDLHWIPNTHSSELDAHLPFNVSAS